MNILFHPRFGGLIMLSIVIVILPFLMPNAFYFDVAIRVGLNAIVCVGLNLLIGYAGQISLGHAGFVGLGAYGSAILTTNYMWPAIPSMIVTAIVSGLLAFFLGRPILRLKGHFLAMATLGMGMIISIVFNTEADITGGPDGMMVDPLMIGGFEVYGENAWYWVVGVVLVVTVWLALNLIESPLGRSLRAVHGSEVAAEVCGVDTAKAKLLIFVVSAVFASISGSLLGHYGGFITPVDASFFKSIELVTMVVLGGMASTYGAVVGAAILTVLPQLLVALEDFEHMVFGLILMLTMIFLPKGIVPTLQAKLKKAPAAEGGTS